MANSTTVGGIPVECLTGELAGVWSGWRSLGDREVVREASAKGTHIDLACKCLSNRRHCSVEEAKIYFIAEVEIWVDELLKKRQIHRASHILKNIGKIPVDYIRAVCLKCKEPSLRDYLTNHVEASFDDDEKEAWMMIGLLRQYEEKIQLQDNLISHMCLEDIKNIPKNIKASIYVELYFNFTKQNTKDFISTKAIWKYLLINNRVDLLKRWIDINYQKSTCDDDDEVFLKSKITDDMIDIVNSKGTIPASQLILDYLSRFGVFTQEDCRNSKRILSRLFSEQIWPEDFQLILSHPSCNVNNKAFFNKLDMIGLSQNYHEIDDIEDIDTNNKNLFDSLVKMCSVNHKDFLESGIVDCIRYITTDVTKFLIENPIVGFYLIYLYYARNKIVEEINFQRIFKEELKTLPKEVLDSVLNNLPDLKLEVEPKVIKNDVTMYHLIDGYRNLIGNEFFKWRSKNKPMPNFLNESLIKKYGHKEKLSYINYLKEARPNMAAMVLRADQDKVMGELSSKVKFQASLCAHVFGLRHLNEQEVISSCIAFLEILGMDSENLRLHVAAAALVRKHLNISIENLLESIIFDNNQDLNTVLNYLERSFQSCLSYKLMEDVEEFVNLFRVWDVIVRFAKIHNTSLPTSLLKFLATHNAWFEYVLIGDVFDYPVTQMLECAQKFDNSSLREHLLLSLRNSQLKSPSSNDKNKSQDRRQSLHFKLDSKTDSPESNTSLGSAESNLLPDKDSINSTVSYSSYTSLITSDLWFIILSCHQSQDPPKALLNASRTFKYPILTVLATCYEPSSNALYCYSWLVISVEDEQITSEYEDCLNHQVWSASKVLRLFQNIISHGYVIALAKGLLIFMPENPLRYFFEFLVQCIVFGNFQYCQRFLQDFTLTCSNLKCNKMMNWECSDGTYLENVYWIETVVLKCIMTAMGSALQSTHMCIEFLKVIVEYEFHKKLTVGAPDFQALLGYTKILSETNISIDFSSFDESEEFCGLEAEIEKCVNELVRVENYSIALRLSTEANLKPTGIILAQYRSEFKRMADAEGSVDSHFWKRCALDFKKYDVCYEQAAEFFVEHAEKVHSSKERYQILKLALEILEEYSKDRKTCDTVEMAMWKSGILAGPENIEIEPQQDIFKKLKTELMSSVSDLQVSCVLTDSDEKEAMGVLIGRLLDAGRVDTALRISAIFNCRHRDLQVLLLCLSLAEGEISPYQLTVQQRSLLSDSSQTKRHNAFRSRGLQRLPSSTSLNVSTGVNSESTVVVHQQEQSDCLSLLTSLLETLQHGIDIATRIILCYRIAVQIGKSYQALLIHPNSMQFFQEVISSEYDRKLELARDVIIACRIENHRIAHFLAEEIVAHITQVIEDGLNDLTSNGNYPLDMNLQSVIELCKDPSLIGLKLLEMAGKLLGHSSGERRNLVTLKIIVELLIRSHDCFTASCNMEGIASVLRKCQQLANSLQNLKHWSLLVRLVTGVGRFTEMSYIFQILKENDQFEFLLGVGLDKVPGLRMALLDFLKRNCPENMDLFNLVALHFRLYYEIAVMWETEAKHVVRDLVNDAKKECGRPLHSPAVDLKFTRNEITEKRLHLAIANFTHATQYYLQDNKLNLANRCSHQAQLLALQIALLGPTARNQQFHCILNLSSDEINKTICHNLNFSQALIVARAYDHHIDWASAIYNHCFVKDDKKYLKDFLSTKKVTAAIVIDCSKRYKLEKTLTKSMMENMRLLVSKLNCETKYVLASQLGFKSLVEEMLENPGIGSFLKDTISRKRYDICEFTSEAFVS